jgi:predicted transcriptional regulator
MTKKLIELASEIVKTQVSKISMTATEIASSLRQVFNTLHELQRAESGEIELPQTKESAPAQALTPEDSIRNDKVICLECGAEMRQLTQKHLVLHGMNSKEYKKKYGFTMKTPLAAKALTKARSKAAKKRGLPEKFKQYLEARSQKKAEVSKPAATKTVTASKQVAAEPIQKGLKGKKPTLTPENSIQNDKIICLECGGEFKQLSPKHLSSHGMSPKEYKMKYGFSLRTPLSAKSIIEAQQKAAKKRGLPENLKKAIEAKRQEKAKAPATASLSDGPGAQRAKRVKRLFSPKKME